MIVMFFVVTLFYVPRPDSRGKTFYHEVCLEDGEWGRLTDFATLHLNAPSVVWSHKPEGQGDRNIIWLFSGHGSTYLVPGWDNASLKHAVVLIVQMLGAEK